MTDIKQNNFLTDKASEAPRGTRGGKSEDRTTGRNTKKQELIRLLGGKNGADIARLSDKLGWQPHSVRAAMTGLRKDGYDIQKKLGPGGKPVRYRISSSRVSPQAGGVEAEK
ncbi:DUF3489 domain-containing protein [Pseudohalocynthiibacter sp. F2068]|jgi:biotin operon repressor|uniref:DUF3489 domain-containing protein n=1 Tax=Pseudohalocynthiibacter sp. F2068 TaxID=2926418 RepID=UPI001FF6E944|nr:DUF3489 domain-containing protein [Pseudohalocynthiibacter sp. F2068]MCK0104321.1 DUF3489 domain-containing protein [Pseudohalocynthiibacter sp. F2068]